jgi:eukaryotic-like serine/threonine-protein kinase
MYLWTDYEGVTIDGTFSLQKLLLPEGRSAFFSTSGSQGEPTVVRLIECHFDEEEILARWRCVEGLNHANFLKFQHYGQIELDGGPVVYAVFEKVDANLAEVLDQGHLTVKDAAQLASSLVTALEVLHTHGFIHEHIEPRNIFAVGNSVKVRSDCIREAPEGEEGRAAKQRDVQDLATVLLQALTQGRSLDGIADYAVPSPFDQIIRNGLDGTWGLEKIRGALEDQLILKQREAPKLLDEAEPTPRFVEQRVPRTPKASVQPEAQLCLPLVDEHRGAEPGSPASQTSPWDKHQSLSLRSRWFGAVGIVAALLLLSTWALARVWNWHRHGASPAAAAVSHIAAPSATQTSSAPPSKPAATTAHASLHASAGARANWRVIAFTYNHRTDAAKKVSSLSRSQPDLQPVVFDPHGRAPYLVSIGGLMDRDAAYALVRRCRSLGLPQDTYAQNYSR